MFAFQMPSRRSFGSDVGKTVWRRTLKLKSHETQYFEQLICADLKNKEADSLPGQFL
jgi:hypothetical protein